MVVKMVDHPHICSCQPDVPFTSFCVFPSMFQQFYVPLDSQAQGTLMMCACLLANNHAAWHAPSAHKPLPLPELLCVMVMTT